MEQTYEDLSIRESQCVHFFSKRCNSLVGKRKVHESRLELEKIGHKS